MAGTRLIVEGSASYRASTLRAASSTEENSLEGGFQVDTITNASVCYVEDVAEEYRWLQDSVLAPSNPTIVIPLGQPLATPGRWIQIAASGVVLGDTVAPVASRALGTAGTSPFARRADAESPLPFYVISSYADLEAILPAVGGVHTQTEGLYMWDGQITATADQGLHIPAGTFVENVGMRPFDGFRTTANDKPAILIDRGGGFGGPFTVVNNGTGGGLSFSGVSPAATFVNWVVVGGTVISAQCRLTACDLGLVTWLGGDHLAIVNTRLAQVLAASVSGEGCRGVYLTNCLQSAGATPLVSYPAGQACVHGVFLSQCQATGILLEIDTDFNVGPGIGPTRPTVFIDDCRSAAGAVNFLNETVPAGGVFITGKFGTDTPLVGITEATLGVRARAMTGLTRALPETPTTPVWNGTVCLESECFLTTGENGFRANLLNGGSVEATQSAQPRHPGAIRFRGNGSTDSGVSYCSDTGMFVVRAGTRFRIKFNTPPVDFNGCRQQLGIVLGMAGGLGFDGGIWFLRDTGTGNLVGQCFDFTVGSTTPILAVLGNNLWYAVEAELNLARTLVEFRVYDDTETLIGSGSLSTNIPADTEEMSFGAVMMGDRADGFLGQLDAASLVMPAL